MIWVCVFAAAYVKLRLCMHLLQRITMIVYAFAAAYASGTKNTKMFLHNASGQKPETGKAWECA